MKTLTLCVQTDVIMKSHQGNIVSVSGIWRHKLSLAVRNLISSSPSSHNGKCVEYWNEAWFLPCHKVLFSSAGVHSITERPVCNRKALT